MSSGSDGKGDIFPQRRVGYNNSGYVDVNSNGLSVSAKFANVSDVRYKTHRTRRSLEYKRTTRDTDPQFCMEPGRTIYVAVSVCNMGHKCGLLNNKDIIIMRDKDRMATAPVGHTLTTELLLDGPNNRVVRLSLEQAQERNTSLVFGELTPADLRQIYTSQSSNTFKSFISDPSLTRNKTDRRLLRRIVSNENVNIFITTLPNQNLTGPLTVKYPYNARVYNEKHLKEVEPRLIVWDTEHAIWVDAGTTCPPHQRGQDYDKGAQTATVNLIAEDDAGGLSEIITIKVYVLAEKCVNNGTCRGPIHDPNCTDSNRIQGFSGYQCTCAAGFTGTYCQVDIDECSSSPCPDNYTCIDQVASYTCHCELGWPCSYKQTVSSQELWKIISASVPSGIILIGLLVFLFIKFRRPAKSKSSSRKSLRGNMDNTDRNTLSRGSGLIRNDLMGYDSGFQNPFYFERPVSQFPRRWFMDNEMSSAENLQVYDDEQEPDYDIQSLRIELTTSSGSGQSPRNPQHGHHGNKESINSDKRPWGEMTV